MPDAPREYVLHLRDVGASDSRDRRLRAALKLLLRNCGWRCTGIVPSASSPNPLTPTAAPAKDTAVGKSKEQQRNEVYNSDTKSQSNTQEIETGSCPGFADANLSAETIARKRQALSTG
jgi:hypothetical protein